MVEAFAHGDFFAVGVAGPKCFALTRAVVGNNAVGGRNNHAGRAVILLQFDDFGVREDLVEVQNVVDGRAAEFVNALVVVADHHDVVFGIAEQLCELELRLVGVLILVHQNIAELVAILFAKLGVLLEQLDCE